jgi:hypothetical protein
MIDIVIFLFSIPSNFKMLCFFMIFYGQEDCVLILFFF